MKIAIIALLLVIQLSFIVHAANLEETGTFSSLYYHEESGDLLGYEIRIVYTRDGYEGTFQAAEGEPEDLILLNKIEITNRNVKFSIPSSSRFKGEFRGKLTGNGLTGTLYLFNGNKITLELKRKQSYWEESGGRP